MSEGCLMGDSLELKDGFIWSFGRKVAKVTKNENGTTVDCVCGCAVSGKSRFMLDEMAKYKEHYKTCSKYELYSL